LPLIPTALTVASGGRQCSLFAPTSKVGLEPARLPRSERCWRDYVKHRNIDRGLSCTPGGRAVIGAHGPAPMRGDDIVYELRVPSGRRRPHDASFKTPSSWSRWVHSHLSGVLSIDCSSGSHQGCRHRRERSATASGRYPCESSA
jgi:hypothetical protein